MRLFAKCLSNFLSDFFSDFLRDESGATAIEYALIAAGVSITIMVAVGSVGTSLNTRFTTISNSLK